MIINTNPVILSDSELPLEETIVGVHTATISNDSVTDVKVATQIGFFLNAEKMLESPTNSLRVEGFTKDNSRYSFQYPTSDTNVFYFFDLQVKAHLLSLYPDWDADKLVITTEPEETE